MSTRAPETLDRGAAPWLFSVALATTLPHAGEQPAWLAGASGLVLASAIWLWWRDLRLPGRWLLLLLATAGAAAIAFEFRTLLGRNAGVATLLLFMPLKLLEVKRRRDAYVVINLGYFLLLTHYFDAQDIPTGLWLLAATTVVTAALIRLHGGAASRVLPTLRYAGLMIAQAIPFMLALYLLFPRISGPLWGLPQDAHAAKTGLPEQVAPGSIADLARNGDIAFRVRFNGPLPRRDQLYWRGPVMEDYDGQTWRQYRNASLAPVVEPLGVAIGYELTLEAHQQRWLLALDAPTQLPPNTALTSSLSAVSREPVRQRQRYAFASAPEHRYNRQESVERLRRDTFLPPDANPRARALAAGWRHGDPDPEGPIRRALAMFREQEFVYTLQPPVLGKDPVDDFLFRTRRGFCEHYATAFVVLMRAAGIPARLVGGYQGGELNSVDGYLVVRQSDAHAWAEVWLADRGWVRVDPTAAVSPARVESGLEASIPAGEALPILIGSQVDWLRHLRHQWEAANNAWNQWVLGYNPERQQQFLARLGLPATDWRTMATVLLATCSAIMLAVAAWILYRRPKSDPAQKLWRKALARLRRRRISCEPWETPGALARRLQNEHPDLAARMAEVAAAYNAARYAPEPTDPPAKLQALRAAVARLP